MNYFLQTPTDRSNNFEIFYRNAKQLQCCSHSAALHGASQNESRNSVSPHTTDGVVQDCIGTDGT